MLACPASSSWRRLGPLGVGMDRSAVVLNFKATVVHGFCMTVSLLAFLLAATSLRGLWCLVHQAQDIVLHGISGMLFQHFQVRARQILRWVDEARS